MAPYDRDSFLAGVAAGRNMESWPAFEGSDKLGIFAYTPSFEGLLDPFTRTPSAEYPYGGVILWGDGEKTIVPPSEVAVSYVHEYESEGDFTVGIVGLAGEMSSFGVTPVKAFLTPLPSTAIITPASLFRGQEQLEYIAPGFFDNVTIKVKTDIRAMFERCWKLRELPDGLLDPFEGKILYADLAFNGYGARTEGSVAIPPDLLKGCSGLRSAQGMFQQANITEIPEGLLQDCYSLERADGMFDQYGATAKYSQIPENLLVSCSGLLNATIMFRGSNIINIPNGLFRNNPLIEHFTGTFEDCRSLIHAPELWVDYPDADGSRCFRYCNNADNYESIPSGWK